MKRLCVIIINYKTPGLTLDCIQTLRGQLDWNKDHIVVVDNNSGGDDIQELSACIAREGLAELVTFVASPDNNGFSAGNNLGINKVDAGFYLLANADTLFRPGAINSLLEAAGKYPRAGLISPRLEWPDGEPQISCFRFHSPVCEIIGSAGTGIITKIFKKYEVPLPLSNQPSRPEWTSFACVVVRKEVFDTIGLLDEGYFMYFEDVDFCRRAASAGFSIVNWPEAHVVHLRGQSSGLKKTQREKKRLPAYYYRSRARYYNKFYGKQGRLLANSSWLAGRSISFLRERLMGKSRTVPEHSFFDIWIQ